MSHLQILNIYANTDIFYLQCMQQQDNKQIKQKMISLATYDVELTATSPVMYKS